MSKQGDREEEARGGIIDSVNYSSVSAICFVCGTTAPGTAPLGWAIWSRTNTQLPYFLHTCPEHSTHEGLWEIFPLKNACVHGWLGWERTWDAERHVFVDKKIHHSWALKHYKHCPDCGEPL